jgi:Arc/MetJ-type ribon-helix-helix transcriptional regulator
LATDVRLRDLRVAVSSRRPLAGRALAGFGTSAVPADPGMVIGMAAKKVTVTLDETQLDRIRALVAAGTAPSVSGFVQHAVGVALDDVAGWGAVLAEALRETGGALSDSERAWADEVLGGGGRSAA